MKEKWNVYFNNLNDEVDPSSENIMNDLNCGTSLLVCNYSLGKV